MPRRRNATFGLDNLDKDLLGDLAENLGANTTEATSAGVLAVPAVGSISVNSGTWTYSNDSAGDFANRGASASNSNILIPISFPDKPSNVKGRRLDSIELYYQTTIADLSADSGDIQPSVYKVDKPANGVAGVRANYGGLSNTFGGTNTDFDINHQTAAGRCSLGHHTMVITPPSPVFEVDAKYYLSLFIDADAAGAAGFVYRGMWVNYTDQLTTFE